jgi:predicted outer membrane repeat protein
MWGTTSFCDELTDDFGGAIEATSIDDYRLFCPLAEI